MLYSTALTVPFASGHERARWVTYLLITTIVVNVISIVSNYMEIELLSSAMIGETITEAEASANDSRQQMIGIFILILWISTAITFLMWFYQVHQNLPALGAQNLQYTPGWAVGGFFVPFLNLFHPFQVACEIWNASDPDSLDGTSWEDSGTPSIVGWWWGLFLIGGFINSFALHLALWEPVTLEGFITISWLNLVSNLVYILEAYFAITMIKGINQRQETKFSRLSSITVSSSQPT